MVDWPGLLKFSLSHSDGTKKSDFTQMDPERRKWLEEAINHYTMAEVRRIQEILAELQKEEIKTQEDEDRRQTMLQEMEELIESLDRGETLYQLGGHMIILNIIFNSHYVQNRITAMRIFCFANQNDAKVQEQSIRVGSFEFVDRALKEQNDKIRQGFFSCLSSLIRGQNLEAKRIFIRIKGLQLIKQALKKPTKRIESKCYMILKDLLYYDDHLHKTYNDLSHFTNTNSMKQKQQKTNLIYDVNQTVTNNELPENEKFKGAVKKWLNDNPAVMEQFDQIKKKEEACE